MTPSPGWVTDETQALLVDLYELTMAQAYVAEGITGRAVFSLYFRTMPAERNYVLACGLDDVLRFLETLRFGTTALEGVRALGGFTDDFLHWLGRLRFSGDVFAVPEGTPLFPGEPILEVAAPIAEAQLLETMVMNQIHVQSVLGSKAARLVTAAAGREVVDFGLRRMHGADAGIKGARAFHIAGLAGTSNVLAGTLYGIPVRGTMAHSYVQAHATELDAFRSFVRHWPEAALLVDTYDTLQGVEHVIALARELGDDFRVRAIRIDSGDLEALAVAARERLDAAGLERMRIVVSGGLDERQIAGLVARGVPADGFGVGSELAVARDAPVLDLVYKLVEYAGSGRLKTSPGKATLPGRKQVFRRYAGGEAVGDVIARADEEAAGQPLLRRVMRAGARTDAGCESLEAARARAAEEIAALPARVRSLDPARPPYPVSVSAALRREAERLAALAAAPQPQPGIRRDSPAPAPRKPGHS
ncbi:MAG TPA: nicotinate phosphoribosyltransferase [Gemmatimonadales bacterium]|nr:nicotinate phosphoribosyltransferase [Gemmatimonadales bacterium]